MRRDIMPGPFLLLPLYFFSAPPPLNPSRPRIPAWAARDTGMDSVVSCRGAGVVRAHTSRGCAKTSRRLQGIVYTPLRPDRSAV
ncbi:hypothetical protein C8R47DRAFT_1158279 [Mycena vitilis]|nr:hypothetical protein C8R47DRAFT_1158279 [Mycena vitilis]